MLLSDITNISPRNRTVVNYSGTGAQVAFTLPMNPGSKNNTNVYISGVYQQKSTYTISGTTLTFSSAPPSGTNNIEVEIGSVSVLSVPADASVTTSKLVDASVTNAKLAFDGGALSGFRNHIINGNFNINQRGYVSGAATTAGQYTLDRWKVTGIGGITFSTTSNKTTVTIPSGQTLQQVIEGLNLQTGTYVLSWEGTAQGKIGAGSYGASGAVTASITGGTNTTIEFGPGTVSKVQFELGTVATPFESRPYGTELALCQRYYEAGAAPFFYIVSTGTTLYGEIAFKVVKRVSPTFVPYNWKYFSGSSPTVVSGLSISISDIYRIEWGFVGATNASGLDGTGNWTASAEL